MKLRYATVLAGGLALASAGAARAADTNNSDSTTTSDSTKMDKGARPTDAASSPKQDVKQDAKTMADTPAAADTGTGSTSADTAGNKEGATPTDAASTPKEDLKQDAKNTGDTAATPSGTKHHHRWKRHAKAGGTGSSASGMKEGASPTDAASTPKEDLKQDAKNTGGTGSGDTAHDTMNQPSMSDDQRQQPDASPGMNTNDQSTRP